MAIRVLYQPTAQSVGEAALAGGLGDYDKWRAAQQMQLLQLGMQQQARQQAMAFDAAQQAAARDYDASRRREALGTNLLMGEIGRRRDLEDAAMRRGWAKEDRAAEEAFRRSAAEEAFARNKELADMEAAAYAERTAAHDTRMAEAARRARIDAGLANGSWAIGGSAGREITRLEGERDKWMAERANPDSPIQGEVSDEKIMELDGRIEDLRYRAARPAKPDEMPKSIDDMIAEQTKFLPQPDGSLLIASMVPGRNGQPPTFRWSQFTSDQAKAIDAFTKDYMKHYTESLTTVDEMGIERKREISPDEYFSQLDKARKAASARFGGGKEVGAPSGLAAGPQPPGAAPPQEEVPPFPVSPQDLMELPGGEMPTAPQVAAQPAPQQPDALNALWGLQYNEIRQVAEQHVNPQMREAAKRVMQEQDYNYYGVPQKKGTPPMLLGKSAGQAQRPKPPAKIDPGTVDLGVKLGVITAVNSPDDLKRLRAGAVVRMPDGTVWTIPPNWQPAP